MVKAVESRAFSFIPVVLGLTIFRMMVGERCNLSICHGLILEDLTDTGEEDIESKLAYVDLTATLSRPN